MRRIASVAIFMAIAACTSSATEPSTSTIEAVTSAMSEASIVTTSPVPTSSIASTPTTVNPPSDFECPPVLVVADHLTRVGSDCSTTSLTLEDSEFDPATFRIMDDFAGGLVYQTDDSAIRWLGTGADRSIVVASVDDAEAESVNIEDVVVIGGVVELWLSRWRGLDWRDSYDIENMVQTLERVVIDGGEPTEVAQVGGWEARTSVTVGGEKVGTEFLAEGNYSFAVRDLELQLLPQPWNPLDPDDPKPVGCDGCPTGLVISDDGSRAVFLSPDTEGATTLAELVVIDLESGKELARLEVSGFAWPLGYPAEGPEITTIDILGDLVLVNGADEGQAFAAVWTDLTAEEPIWGASPVPGRARFLRSDVRFDDLETITLS
jgi:hypothetical protein